MSDKPRITLYGTEYCSYCAAAKMLLKKKQLAYDEISVSADADKRAEMEQRSGRRSVPQIFIDEQAIGGFDELHALEKSGELDRLLGN